MSLPRSWGLRLCVGLGGAWGMGSWARRRVDAVLRDDPSNAYAWATLAHWRAEGGDLGGACTALERCVDLEPEHALHWFNLGFIFERMERFAEAERAFRRATELDPRLDCAWYGLALALIAQDRLAEATEPLMINTRLQPMSPHGWYQLARVQCDLGAQQEARLIVQSLRGFEPKVAAQLARETGL